MTRYTLTHLADRTLLHDLRTLIARDRATTAELLAHLAEVDARRLYLPAAYSSMWHWCVGELHLSEDAAAKRIQAARAARDFPAIFEALADGRLHLSAIVMLAPHLTRANAGELLAAAAHKTKSAISLLLAERAPRPDVPARVTAIPASYAPAAAQAFPAAFAPIAGTTPPAPIAGATPPAPIAGATPPAPVAGAMPPAPIAVAMPLTDRAHDMATSCQHAPGHVGTPAARSTLRPLAPQRFALQVTLTQETHDKLRRAQALLGHAVGNGDLAQVLDRALDALVAGLERRKFANTSRPRRPAPRPRANHDSPRTRADAVARERRIPANVRRDVWRRDGGRCTFTSADGRRCDAVARLEFDHVTPVTRGGLATASNLRLRCRAHNQHDADRTFGRAFMDAKRRGGRTKRLSPSSPAAP